MIRPLTSFRFPRAAAAVLALATVAMGAVPAQASAGGAAEPGSATEMGATLPLWSGLPFVGILLSIALFPLLAPHFWHRHFPKIAAAWAVITAVPLVLAYRGAALEKLIETAVVDYLPFLILLWALFTIAGGIYVGGALRGTPAGNLGLLLAGTALASWIGTTGASMVMIRPLLRANAWRRRQVHLVVAFIMLVGNVGGSLTPLGDPPLFLGFLHGVPFFWVTGALWEVTGFVVAILAVLFYFLDRRFYRRENPPPRETGDDGRLRVEGAHNLLLLLGVIVAVLLSGSVRLGTLRLPGGVAVALEGLARDALLVALGLLSLRTTRAVVRRNNQFTWGPIREVAIIFAGIFAAMVPVLAILHAGEHGALAGLIRAVRGPAAYFWATGGLSSFLDNAPTYLTFFNTALGSFGPDVHVLDALRSAGAGSAGAQFARDLTAISAGAVFMGANTYIGNAPNFMIRSIAEEAGVPMPSFFGYFLRYSVPILVPVFAIVTLIFFR
jgi:Na+/H+ antiporter NhaD/arsenite permease-like protein